VDPGSLVGLRTAWCISLPQTPFSATIPCHGTPRNCLTAQTSIYAFMSLCYFCLIGTNLDTSLSIHTSENNSFIPSWHQTPGQVKDNKHLSWTYTSHQSQQRNCPICLCYQIYFTIQSGVRIGRRVPTDKTNIILMLVATCSGTYISQGCPRTCHNWHTLGDGLNLDSLTSCI